MRKGVGPIERGNRIIFGVFLGNPADGGILHFSGGQGGGPVGRFGGISTLNDLAGDEIHETGSFAVACFLSVHGEANGKIGIGIDQSVDGSPLHPAAVLSIGLKAVEVGKRGVGVRSRPTREGGRHVPLGSFSSIEDSFLAGDGAPLIMEVTELGAVRVEMNDLLAHEFGILGRQVGEDLIEKLPAFEGRFGCFELDSDLADFVFGEFGASGFSCRGDVTTPADGARISGAAGIGAV